MFQAVGSILRAARRGLAGAALAGIFALGASPAAWAISPEPAVVETVRLGALDLKGRHIRPPGSGLATVVLVHDTLGAYEDPLIATMQEALSEAGVATLAINLSLGENGRMEPLSCNIRHGHRHEDALDEIDAWVDWLLGEGLGPVILAGHGRGGAQIAWHLAKRIQGRAAAAILLAPTGWTPRQADAEYRARYAAGLAALLTRIAGAKPEDVIDNVPFLHCGAVDATQASIQSYYGVEPLRDTPTALEEATTPVLALMPDKDEDAPENDVLERMEALENPAVVVRRIEGADAQFGGAAFQPMAEAFVAYVRSILTP